VFAAPVKRALSSIDIFGKILGELKGASRSRSSSAARIFRCEPII
jgi:hypothetical protein